MKAAHRFRRETKIVNTSLHGIVSDRENRGTDLRETKESQVVIILRIAVLSVPGLLPPDHVHLALRLRDKHIMWRGHSPLTSRTKILDQKDHYRVPHVQPTRFFPNFYFLPAASHQWVNTLTPKTNCLSFPAAAMDMGQSFKF